MGLLGGDGSALRRMNAIIARLGAMEYRDPSSPPATASSFESFGASDGPLRRAPLKEAWVDYSLA